MSLKKEAVDASSASLALNPHSNIDDWKTLSVDCSVCALMGILPLTVPVETLMSGDNWYEVSGGGGGRIEAL